MNRNEAFAELLKERIKRHGIEKLSEDCIRYDYFSAVMEKEKRKASDLILEYTHDNRKYGKEENDTENNYRKKRRKKEIDCVIVEGNMPGTEKPVEAIEFKFFADYENPKAAVDTAGKIGALFADCYRLLDSKIEQKTIVLVSAKTMIDYIQGNSKHKRTIPDVSFLFDEKNEKKIENGFIAKIQKSKEFCTQIEKKTYPGIKLKPFIITNVFFRKDKDDTYAIAVFRVRRKK